MNNNCSIFSQNYRYFEIIFFALILRNRQEDIDTCPISSFLSKHRPARFRDVPVSGNLSKRINSPRRANQAISKSPFISFSNGTARTNVKDGSEKGNESQLARDQQRFQYRSLAFLERKLAFLRQIVIPVVILIIIPLSSIIRRTHERNNDFLASARSRETQETG